MMHSWSASNDISLSEIQFVYKNTEGMVSDNKRLNKEPLPCPQCHNGFSS
jgi:hypothetical protein